MKQEFLKIIEHFSERKSINKKTKVSIFFICFTISLFIWFLIKMSQDYTSEVSIPIEFSNPPEGLMHTVTFDSTVNIRLTARGFDLLNLSFFKSPDPILVDIAASKIRKDRYAMSSYIISSSINEQLAEQVDFAKEISHIYPDTLRFNLEKIISKEVKVIGDIDFTTKSQYQIYGDIQIHPKSIIISGPPSIIDTISSIYTRKFKIIDADKNITSKLSLLKPDNKKITLSDDSVDLSIQIEKFTENIVKVPLHINKSDQDSIKLFPESVNVKYLIALKDFSNFQNEMLVIGIHFDKTKNKQNVEIFNQPEFIKVTSIEPNSIDYIILK